MTVQIFFCLCLIVICINATEIQSFSLVRKLEFHYYHLYQILIKLSFWLGTSCEKEYVHDNFKPSRFLSLTVVQKILLGLKFIHKSQMAMI